MTWACLIYTFSLSFSSSFAFETGRSTSSLESVQDFLIKLDIKPLRDYPFKTSACSRGEGSKICQICRRIVLKNCRRQGGRGQKSVKICRRLKWMVPKCNNSNSTLAVCSGFDLHRFLQVLSKFGKKIVKDQASDWIQT